MRSARAGCLGCVVVVLAAGCGSSSETSSPATTATTGSQSVPVTTSGAAAAEILGANVATAGAGKPGVVVQSIPGDTKSQLRTGDVIVAYNGKRVGSVEELHRLADPPVLGKPFSITVIRSSHRVNLTEVPTAVTFLGVQAKDSSGSEGAAVAAVEPDSPADKAGLRPGDLITSVGGEQVAEVQDLLEAVGAHHPGDTVLIAFRRDSRELQTRAALTTRPAP